MRQVRRVLSAHVAGRPDAATTYEFYEILDRWLGPWGEDGYLLGYAKPYNIAYTSNPFLLSNPITRGWVFRTAALLQERMLEYVVGRYRRGTLWKVTEADIRKVGFKSHSLAYQQAGFANMVLGATGLVPIVALLSAPELHPKAENFELSIEQVVSLVQRITPEVAQEMAMRPWRMLMARVGALMGRDLYAAAAAR